MYSKKDKQNKKKNNIPPEIEKKINDRIAQLYKDQSFRLKLEQETSHLKTPQDFSHYIQEAEKKSREETKEQK